MQCELNLSPHYKLGYVLKLNYESHIAKVPKFCIVYVCLNTPFFELPFESEMQTNFTLSRVAAYKLLLWRIMLLYMIKLVDIRIEF